MGKMSNNSASPEKWRSDDDNTEWIEQFNIQKSQIKNKKLKAYKQRRKQFPVTNWSIRADKWLESAAEKEIELDEIEDKYYWPLYALTTEPKKLSEPNKNERFERKDSKQAKPKSKKSGRSRSFPLKRPKSLHLSI